MRNAPTKALRANNVSSERYTVQKSLYVIVYALPKSQIYESYAVLKDKGSCLRILHVYGQDYSESFGKGEKKVWSDLQNRLKF